MFVQLSVVLKRTFEVALIEISTKKNRSQSQMASAIQLSWPGLQITRRPCSKTKKMIKQLKKIEAKEF